MSFDLDRITHPLRLAKGSHEPGSGKGCAMNVISYINGDTRITDYPECSARPLARIVQSVNDMLAGMDGYLSPDDSVLVLDLGWSTVGTAAVPDSVQWQWLSDLLVHPERGVVKYARPDGVAPIRRVAELLALRASGTEVSLGDWRAARDSARNARQAAAAAADAYTAAYAAAYADADAAAYAAADAAAYAYAAADAAADAAAYAAAATDAYAAADAAADAAAYAAAYAAADADAAAYAAAYADANAAADAAANARIDFARWAIQHWRDLAGLDRAPDIDPTAVDSALERIHA